MKPGYKTSEFWFTLVSFIFSGLYLTGILTENEHKEELIQVVTHAVESVILIGGQILILQKYIKGRTEVKKTYEQQPGTNKKPGRPTNTKNKRVAKKPKKNSN